MFTSFRYSYNKFPTDTALENFSNISFQILAISVIFDISNFLCYFTENFCIKSWHISHQNEKCSSYSIVFSDQNSHNLSYKWILSKGPVSMLSRRIPSLSYTMNERPFFERWHWMYKPLNTLSTPNTPNTPSFLLSQVYSWLLNCSSTVD